MKNASKPLNKIAVDGRFYLWEASSGQNSYIVTIRSADGPGQVLHVTGIPLPAQDMRSMSAENEVGGTVPQMIRAALRREWRPDSQGLPDFYL